MCRVELAEHHKQADVGCDPVDFRPGYFRLDADRDSERASFVGAPLSFFLGFVAAMETDLRAPCDLSALKAELAKAILADAETTERYQ